MGVKGLWRLLLPIGRRISIETLEGKILAIDASIWLTQFLKAMRDPDTGQVRSAAHLIGFFRRLCKLRYHGIRPVFVFDGATPEIKQRELRERRKRREQFSNMDSDDAIQRMAKRLLAQQLKKKEGAKLSVIVNKHKKTNKEESKGEEGIATSSTSYAPGFYDPQMEEESKQEGNEQLPGKEHQGEKADGPRTQDETMDENDTSESIIDLLQDEEIINATNHQDEQQRPSDWDTAILPQPSTEEGETTRETRKQSRKNDIRTFANKYKFNADYVASLPSTERKDAVEDAQRHRRLESRREFMKVAYDPEGLSQCQLRNFLKSTKLNKNIQKMAVQAAKNDGVDTLTANGNKIIFVKDESKNSKSAKAQRNRQIRKLAVHAREKGLPLMAASSSSSEGEDDEEEWHSKKDDDDDDDDEDIEWEDSFQVDGEAGGATTSNRRAILDDDDESSVENDEVDGGGGFLTSAATGVDRTTTVPFHHGGKVNNPSNKDDDEEGGGGFLPPVSEQSESPRRTSRKMIHIHDSDEEEEGGGFLASSENDDEKNRTTAALNSTENSMGVARRPVVDMSHPSTREEAGGGFLLPDSEHDSKPAAQSDEGGGAFLLSSSEHDSKPAVRQTVGSDEQDCDEGGGFIVSKSDSDMNPAARRRVTIDVDNDKTKARNSTIPETENDAKIAQQLRDEELAQELQQSEYQDEEGGGFLLGEDHQQSHAVARCPTAVTQKSETQIRQEKQDELLARSLQSQNHRTLGLFQQSDESDDENSANGGFLTQSQRGVSTSQEAGTVIDLTQSKRFPLSDEPETNHDAIETGPLHTEHTSNFNRSRGQQAEEAHPAQTGGIDDSSEEEDLDWEDGDCATETGMDPKKLTDTAGECAQRDIPNNLTDDKKDFSPENSNAEIGAIEGKDQHILSGLRKASELNHSEEVDDDNVDWEDGQPSENMVDVTAQKKTGDATLAADREKNDFGERSLMVDSNDEDCAFVDNGDSWGADFSRSTHKPKDIAAALEHAQMTAANLTNWAGRAFRRAVAQHAEETGLVVPDAAKPKVLLDTKRSGQTQEVHPEPKASFRAGKVAARVTDSTSIERSANPSIAASEPKPRPLDSAAVLESLAESEEKWTQERNQQERDMDTVTDEMRAEAMELLHLFGVPFVEAPAEAEAQCVMLEKLGLVDGVVTEDSDAFVFGAQAVYKNIFEDKKYVEVYHSRDAVSEMNLTHDAMVALAMLLGGDYTEGVRGVGIVNGMEILDAFDVAEGLQEGLVRFREWLNGFDPTDIIPIQKGKEDANKERDFHRKHYTARARWVAPKYFPDPKVLNAYLNPVVDTSKDSFSWGIPDLEKLLVFCNRYAGWNPAETAGLLEPVQTRLESGSMRQTRIDSFMRYEDGIKFASIRSKRLREVLGKVKSKGQKRQKRDDTKSKHF